jgi:hypothetical protein
MNINNKHYCLGKLSLTLALSRKCFHLYVTFVNLKEDVQITTLISSSEIRDKKSR